MFFILISLIPTMWGSKTWTICMLLIGDTSGLELCRKALFIVAMEWLVISLLSNILRDRIVLNRYSKIFHILLHNTQHINMMKLSVSFILLFQDKRVIWYYTWILGTIRNYFKNLQVVVLIFPSENRVTIRPYFHLNWWRVCVITHFRTEVLVNLDMFSKICILIWFGKVYVCGTSAELSGLPNTKNGSTFHCPSFETVRLHWQDFHPFTHYNSSSKSLEGDLSRYMNTALNACCPRLRIYDEKINITSSCEMEILIRRNHDKNPVIHFPIFSNKGETEQLQRRFVALFHSPGPAVLKFGHGSDPFSNRFLYLLKNVWALVLISFLHALLAGIIIWALVRTLKQPWNLLFMVSSRRFFLSFYSF